MKSLIVVFFIIVIIVCVRSSGYATDFIESPFLKERVASGLLPPIAARLPQRVSVVEMEGPGQEIGRHGGTLRMLMARSRDTRILYVYSYARLVVLTPEFTLEPDIVERFTVEDGRIFTFFLRPGHRWSDGHPFTSEDFRYWWQDIANNQELRPFGPPSEILLNGQPPVVTILDQYTIQYAWSTPHPNFLLYLASARPEQIYAPAHYLKQFNPRYTDPETLNRRILQSGQKSWTQLHNRNDNLNRFDNPELPVLQPWVVTNRAPSIRFVFERNPYYHRIDTAGRQLPYIDRILVTIADSKIISAKTGAGESDLQARYLRFDDYTFLKQGEQRHNYQVRLWRTGSGSHIALFPNLNVQDEVWRTLLRDVRFRRALSLGIDREEINQVLYYGLAISSNNTVLEHSPLFRTSYRDLWTTYDLQQANRLLDDIGLTRRNFWGTRLLPNGKTLDIIIETAGESTEETDVLQLIKESWRRLGIRLFTRPLQREVLRNRIYSGQTLMTIARGVDNGIPIVQMSPHEFVPTAQVHYQWPKWGQYYQTKGQLGLPPDLLRAQELLTLLQQWQNSSDIQVQTTVWHRILENHAQQQWTIGIITGVLQPVVVHKALRNVPQEGLYNYEPGAHFGLYRPDTFWRNE